MKEMIFDMRITIDFVKAKRGGLFGDMEGAVRLFQRLADEVKNVVSDVEEFPGIKIECFFGDRI